MTEQELLEEVEIRLQESKARRLEAGVSYPDDNDLAYFVGGILWVILTERFEVEREDG